MASSLLSEEDPPLDDYTTLDNNWMLLVTLPLIPLPLLVLVWYSQWLYYCRLRPTYHLAQPQVAARSNKRAVLSYLEGETWAEHLRRSERDERLHKLGNRLWVLRRYGSTGLYDKKGQETWTTDKQERSKPSTNRGRAQSPQPSASPVPASAGHSSKSDRHLPPDEDSRFPSGASAQSPSTGPTPMPHSGTELGVCPPSCLEGGVDVGGSGSAAEPRERPVVAGEVKMSSSSLQPKRVAFERRTPSGDKTESRRCTLPLVELRQQSRWRLGARGTAVDPAPPMQQGSVSEDLVAVRLQRVLDDLGTGDNYGIVAHVMTELYKGCSYLEPCLGPDGTLRGSMALISYRIVKSQVDDFTLDPAAFLSLMGAAAEAGVDFLWLDCWAYRKQPPWAEYHHDDFCRTLGTVLGLVDRVLWLPRSREDAPGQYQYRVWCTFEACVIGLRKLPVLVCGYKPTSTQLMIASLGSLAIFPPWWVGDGTRVVFLGKLNFIFLLVSTCVLWTYAMRVAVYHHEKEIVWRAVLDFAVLQGFSMAVYMYVRSGMSQEVMLAQNAKRVMRLMLSTAAGRVRGQWKKISQLKRTLPWLPAHDRRDVVTVNITLANLASQLRSRNSSSASPESDRADPLSDSCSISAVALSVYFHALAKPTPTDDPAGRTLREWLEDAGIHLPSEPGEKCNGTASVDYDCENNTALWLDEYPLVQRPRSKSIFGRLSARMPGLCSRFGHCLGRCFGFPSEDEPACSADAGDTSCPAPRSGADRRAQLRGPLARRRSVLRILGKKSPPRAEGAPSTRPGAEMTSPQAKPADAERATASGVRAAAVDSAHSHLSRSCTARTGSLAGSGQFMQLDTRSAAASSFRCSIPLAELQRLHWEFVRLRFGATCCVVNPMGDYALAFPEVRPNGTARWKLQRMLKRRSIQNSLQAFGITYFALFFATTMTEMVGTLFGLLNDNEKVYLKVLDVVRVLNVIQSALVYALGIIKLKADISDIVAGCKKKRGLVCMPLPVRRSGKIELTLPLATFCAYLLAAANAWIQWYDEDRETLKTSFSDAAWRAFSFNAIWWIGYEAALCIVSMVSAVIALRRLSGASEFFTPYVEKTSVVV